MGYKITDNNIKIIDSYKVPKCQFNDILAHLRSTYPELSVWHRSFASLKLEWACHNAAYSLGYKRNRTADTDLNYPQSWYERTTYFIMGCLVWLFIK